MRSDERVAELARRYRYTKIVRHAAGEHSHVSGERCNNAAIAVMTTEGALWPFTRFIA